MEARPQANQTLIQLNEDAATPITQGAVLPLLQMSWSSLVPPFKECAGANFQFPNLGIFRSILPSGGRVSSAPQGGPSTRRNDYGSVDLA